MLCHVRLEMRAINYPFSDNISPVGNILKIFEHPIII